jgi:hypothetical protein
VEIGALHERGSRSLRLERLLWCQRRLKIDPSASRENWTPPFGGSWSSVGVVTGTLPGANLGFYYNTAGIGYSDRTPHIGTYNATLDQLNQLEGVGVTVDIAP